MSTYSNKQLAKMYGTSKRTLENHIAKLKEQKKFTKKAIGRYYNQQDAELLSILLGFPLTQESAK